MRVIHLFTSCTNVQGTATNDRKAPFDLWITGVCINHRTQNPVGSVDWVTVALILGTSTTPNQDPNNDEVVLLTGYDSATPSGMRPLGWWYPNLRVPVQVGENLRLYTQVQMVASTATTSTDMLVHFERR